MNRRRGSVLAVLAMLAVLLGAELVARWLAPGLPEPDLWGDRSRALKAAQLATVAEQPGCVDVVLVGNSMARDAFDPSWFSAADPHHRTAYNAALDAAGPTLVHEWLDRAVLAQVEPAVVVIAVASVDLNVAAPAGRAALASWRTATAGRPGLLGWLDRTVTERSALIAHRNELRDPDTLADAVTTRLADGEVTEDAPTALIGPSGQGLSRRSLTFDPAAPDDGFLRDQLTAGFDLGPDPGSELASLVDDLLARGVEVVLVSLPITDAYRAAHPERTDVDEATAVVAQVADRREVPHLDLREALGPAAFADTHHLNASGAEWFSSTLPGLIGPTRSCGTGAVDDIGSAGS